MLRKYLIAKALKAAPEKGTYQGWEAVKSIQLLVDLDPNIPRPEIEALEKALIAEGKHVETITFQRGKKPKIDVPANSYYRQDLSFLSVPTKATAAKMGRKADVLIDWSTAKHCPNDFLAIASNASLKLGIDRHLPCFTITITGQNNMPNKVIDEILKYLKMINHG